MTSATCPTLHASLLALDPDQRAAVLSGDHATLVHAQVGSGKTTVLVHRAAYLHVVGGVPLERIAILTFTNRAADELRQRLDALLGRATTTDERWLVGTFHSVASALLRRALPVTRVGRTRRFTILDEEAAIELAVAVIRRHRIRPGRRATLLDRLRTDPALAEMRDAVAAERRVRDAMDFDDLIDHATSLLADGEGDPDREPGDRFDDSTSLHTVRVPATTLDRHADARSTSRPALAHLLIDELQDCEPRELAFVRALLSPGAQLFAVGDPLQSIYGWRGSAPTLFAPAEWSCRVRTLPRSYRSTQTVLAGARAILGEQPVAIGELVPVRAPGPKIAIVRHHDITAEAAYLAARLAELHAAGARWDELAVLCRLRVQVADLASALAMRGIPCVHDLDTVEPTVSTARVRDLTEPRELAGVRILTIHAAKGLEFTHVFISGANVGVLPLLSRDAGEADHCDPAEERRLLFVAITRARDAVEISYQARPHTHGAFGVASPLLLLLPDDVVAREPVAASAAIAPDVTREPSTPEPAAVPGEWRVGQRVRHPRYGHGTIVAIADDTFDCDFGKLGPRAFPRAMCVLTVA